MFLLTAVLATAAFSQTIREETVYGRPAYILENGLIRVAVLKGGGHLAEIRLLSQDVKKSINPMRVPHYQTIDPNIYDPAKHDAIYGQDTHRWLSAGYMGHLLCFPFYGPPSSPEEVKAMLGNHGEAPIVEWKKDRVEEKADSLTLWVSAELKRTEYRVSRAITMKKNYRHVRVEEWVENLASYDRPFQWMQHATFGPPFVEPGKTVLDVSAGRGLTAERGPNGSLASSSLVQWPNGTDPDGKQVDLRKMQPREKSTTYVALVMDRARTTQFFTMYHPDYPVLIGYVFPTEQNPWIADWQENKSSEFIPWNGKVVARGIEFGNSPFAEGLKKAVERGSLFEIPAFRWIGAKQKLKNEFTVFLDEIPPGFKGVKDVRVADGMPSIVPQ